VRKPVEAVIRNGSEMVLGELRMQIQELEESRAFVWERIDHHLVRKKKTGSINCKSRQFSFAVSHSELIR
jgi:hypothetical protein